MGGRGSSSVCVYWSCQNASFSFNHWGSLGFGKTATANLLKSACTTVRTFPGMACSPSHVRSPGGQCTEAS